MITARDIKLVKDVALSHVLSRDQVIALGYFESVNRANRRLAALVKERSLRVITTPFHSQRLYAAGEKAHEVVGEKIARILGNRSSSPRFLQHSLAVTNVRIALLKRGWSDWRFEQQIRDSVMMDGKTYEIRADGLVASPVGLVFIEADLGHVSRRNFSRKVEAFDQYAKSGRHKQVFKMESLRVLVITTGHLRKTHLKDFTKNSNSFTSSFMTFNDLGVDVPGGWS